MAFGEDRDWRKRQGRFRNCERDEPDRMQIKPTKRPDDVMRETHAHDPGGGYRDGLATDMDT